MQLLCMSLGRTFPHQLLVPILAPKIDWMTQPLPQKIRCSCCVRHVNVALRCCRWTRSGPPSASPVRLRRAPRLLPRHKPQAGKPTAGRSNAMVAPRMRRRRPRLQSALRQHNRWKELCRLLARLRSLPYSTSRVCDHKVYNCKCPPQRPAGCRTCRSKSPRSCMLQVPLLRRRGRLPSKRCNTNTAGPS